MVHVFYILNNYSLTRPDIIYLLPVLIYLFVIQHYAEVISRRKLWRIRCECAQLACLPMVFKPSATELILFLSFFYLHLPGVPGIFFLIAHCLSSIFCFGLASVTRIAYAKPSAHTILTSSSPVSISIPPLLLRSQTPSRLPSQPRSASSQNQPRRTQKA